ncbi:methyl-accepting chemotaxis protein, partial [Pseudomonas fragi]|nr:methyl-accepting chemotaxis protein [Pseudomonas sp. GC01]
MNSWLSNISVNLKLTLGFGLVLLLTCVMAIFDWLSLDKMVDRSNWMSDITRLNTAFTNLRVTRLQYMLTDGDETAAQAVQGSIDAFQEQQKKLIDTFKSQENLVLLKEQQAIIGDYERALVTMRKAYVESAEARAAMDRNAKLAQDAIATLLASTLQLPAAEESRFAMYQTVSEVREQFLLSRYQVRAYIAAPTPATEKAASQQLEKTVDSLEKLNPYFATSAA